MAVPLWILAVLAVGVGLGFAVSIPSRVRGAGMAHPAGRRARARRHRARLAHVPASGHRRRPAGRRFRAVRDAAAIASGSTTRSSGSTAGLLLGFSRIVGWIDRYLVDGVLNVLSAWTLDAGDRLRRIQTGQPQDYVYGVAVGVLLLLVWFHWLG